MDYCPYCSTPLQKSHKVCPHCKKSISFDMLQALYQSAESTAIDKKIYRKIWLQEHAHIIKPLMALLIGLLSGTLVAYFTAHLQFNKQRSDYQNQISILQDQINNNQNAAVHTHDALQQQIQKKEQILKILKGQLETLSSIINITRRLAMNSTITPNTVEEGLYYQRNIRYLIRQFENQNEELKATEYENTSPYNLQTLPQLLSEGE